MVSTTTSRRFWTRMASRAVLAAALLVCSAVSCSAPPTAPAPGPTPQAQPGTLLLTGFEPFAKLSTNTSWEVARRLDGQMVGGLRIKSVLLPVVWEKTRAQLAEAIRQTDPRAAVVMGVAWWGVVAVESTGRNFRGRHKDNEDAYPSAEKIYDNGPAQLGTRLPVQQIVETLQSLDVPVRSSDTAGTYLCNEVLYTVLHETRDSGIPAGLLHLPRAGPDRAKHPTRHEVKVRTVSVGDLAAALREALQVVAAQVEASAGTTSDDR